MEHRGPDEQGFHESGPAALVHRRLSIIDLTTGQQPMLSSDGQVCVSFNGEIYNFPELKADLEAQGWRFKTTSDTEVLLALYQRYGLDAFPMINGMIAGAFWDSRSRELVLVRDRFGKKPLFYSLNDERFLFGSEVKAILAYARMEKQVNAAAIHEYLTYGYILGEETAIAGIRRLPPAHYLVLKNGRINVRSYWQFRFQQDGRTPSEPEVLERLDDLLRGAVRRRMMSDVPLGAFLSGGIDSSAVVALMTQISDQRVKTFTIGFDEAGYSEIEDARTVAKHLGTDHHEMIVTPSALDILPDLVWHMDEPFGDSSAVPTYYVCKAARRHVTVTLSGDGGDEVFAGYRRYGELAQLRRMARVPGWSRDAIFRPLTRRLPFTWPAWNRLFVLGQAPAPNMEYRLGLYPYIQEQLYSAEMKERVSNVDPFRQLDRILHESAALDPVSRYQYLDTLQYLPADILTKVDRMSMANSLEVRSPLLDFNLVEYAASLPLDLKLRDGVSKFIFRKYCRKLLPASVLAKRKQGFAIPKDRWFQKDLQKAAYEILTDRKTLARGYFNPGTLDRLMRHHMTGRRDYSTWIWCLIVLELWLRTYIDERAETDAVLRLPKIALTNLSGACTPAPARETTP